MRWILRPKARSWRPLLVFVSDLWFPLICVNTPWIRHGFSPGLKGAWESSDYIPTRLVKLPRAITSKMTDRPGLLDPPATQMWIWVITASQLGPLVKRCSQGKWQWLVVLMSQVPLYCFAFYSKKVSRRRYWHLIVNLPSALDRHLVMDQTDVASGSGHLVSPVPVLVGGAKAPSSQTAR